VTWAPDYVTSTVAKSWLRIDDTDDDAQVSTAIAAASRSVDRATGRQFGLTAAEDRTYASGWWRHEGVYRAIIDDLMTTSGLVVTDPAGDTVSSDDYALGPVNAAAKGRPWEWIDLPTSGDYVITASWGWSSVPSTITGAVLLQVSRLLARRESPFGVAGSPAAGSELRLLARLDPDVDVMVRPYRRRWATA
jgi:hypothetical protein